MAKKLGFALLVWCVLVSSCQLALGKEASGEEEGWISLFDGKTLNGWKASENKDTFSVRDGMIVVDGPRSHLFYVGPVGNADFKNFEIKAEVMTKPGANSGIYFHTEYQERGWPARGFEVQVNNSHSDWRKSGSLWDIKDVREGPKDNEWFTEHIIVRDKHVVIKVNGKTTVDWTEPEDWKPPRGMPGRKISRGTFALQGHDPKSVIYYKNIKVKPLPSESDESQDGWINLFDGTLNGWKASENKDTFSVRDGMIVVDGPRSHLFYVGPVENADFKNFEIKAEVMTKPGANSGIYFHTEYQEKGWPDKGYEVQVNNTHSDWRKTGSLYAIKDVRGSSAKDNEWFTEHIIVQDKQIIIKVNGQTTVDYTEPENVNYPRFPGRKIARGTFALQGHDPKSVIYYKNIMVKLLPEKIKIVVLTGGHGFEREPFFKLFQGYDDIEYVEFQLKDHSEIFEDISNWDYDVIAMYSMTQNISQKRKDNFKKLLDRGIGLVALHHNMGSFQNWPEFKKIIGGKYYLKPTEEHRGSTFKHDIDMNVRIADTSHPITRGMSDFKIHDEGYKYCGFEKNNRVLITTEHPDCDKTIGWVRRYGKSRVCGIMLGHDSAAYTNPNFRQLIARSIRWTAGRLD